MHIHDSCIIQIVFQQLIRADSTPDDQSDTGGDTPQIRALEAAEVDSQELEYALIDSQALALPLQTFDTEMSLALTSDLDTPPLPPIPIDYGE